VIIAQCSRLTSMITPANRSAAVIIVSRRRDHEFVIIAPVFKQTLFRRYIISHIYRVQSYQYRLLCSSENYKHLNGVKITTGIKFDKVYQHQILNYRSFARWSIKYLIGAVVSKNLRSDTTIPVSYSNYGVHDIVHCRGVSSCSSCSSLGWAHDLQSIRPTVILPQ